MTQTMEITEKEQKVYDTLHRLGIAYERYQHAAAFTMEQCAAVDAGIPATHVKNLFLCNRQGTSYYLLLIRADKKFRTAEVSPQIGCSRLSFGSAEKLLELLGLEPGAIGPMGLINDAEKEVSLLVDEDLKHSDVLCVHPNVNTASIVLSAADFFGVFLRHTGHVPEYVSVSALES